MYSLSRENQQLLMEESVFIWLMNLGLSMTIRSTCTVPPGQCQDQSIHKSTVSRHGLADAGQHGCSQDQVMQCC